MTWLLVAFFLGLLYLAVNQSKIANKRTFRIAWEFFALVPASHFVFALFRAANSRSSRDLALVEIWANGFAWLLLAISLVVLVHALVPTETSNTEQGG